MARLLLASLLFIVVLSLGDGPSSVRANSENSGVTVAKNRVESIFPEGLLFNLAVSSDSIITDVRLRYEIQERGRGVISTVQPDFEPSNSISLTYTLDGNSPPRIYIQPGAVIDYFWEVRVAGGETFTTEVITTSYEDIRFAWKTISSGVVSVHYYGDSEDMAVSMLQAAGKTLEEMETLLGAKVDFSVQVWLYASPDDMRPALPLRSERFDSQVLTLGARVADETIVVLGSRDALDTFRHELTHVITFVAGEGDFGSLPAWLDEGSAVYAQNNPGAFKIALDRAVSRGNVLSLPSMTSPTGNPVAVNLFYGQSWGIVSYLVGTFGAEKFAKLFSTLKGGSTIDDALFSVYGFDQIGLESQWRDSVGLPPRQLPTSDPIEAESTEAAPAPRQPIEAADSGGGFPIGPIAALLAASGAFVTAVGVAGYVISRRMR